MVLTWALAKRSQATISEYFRVDGGKFPGINTTHYAEKSKGS